MAFLIQKKKQSGDSKEDNHWRIPYIDSIHITLTAQGLIRNLRVRPDHYFAGSCNSLTDTCTMGIIIALLIYVKIRIYTSIALLFKNWIVELSASKMAQQVETFAGKPKDPSRVSQTHMVGRTNSQKLSSGLHTCSTAMHPHTTQAHLNVPKLEMPKSYL